ncbi:MAG: CoA pyrophosphatase [Propionibacteriales bacterium]|nr:CoA pyrophosphatase [Propionibacteriales bacterium]
MSVETPTVPCWLQTLVAASADLTAGDLTQFTAPAGTKPRPASVLVLFGGDADSTGERRDVLLLERAHDMRSHAGQVAFPGGAQDRDDVDEIAAALREAQEETNLDPDGVEVLAALPPLWLPPSNFAVSPVIAWWRQPSDVCAVDPAETASVHTVPLQQLLDPANRATMRHPSGFLGPAFMLPDLVVWGFTAGLLSRIFVVAGWERPWDAGRVVDLPADLVSSSRRDLDRMPGRP